MLSKRAIINEVIKEWSWQVPSGMPDATNPEHLEILRSVLSEEFDISKYETDQFIFLLQEERAYKNNAQNRALGRVGLPYGSKGTPPDKEDKKELSPEEKKAKKIKDKQEEIAAKTKEALDRVAWDPEEDRAEFEDALDKITSSEKLSKEELAMLNKYAKIKASDSEVAIYMSNRKAGDFRQGSRVKVPLGNSADAKAVKQQMLDAGMEEAAAVTGTDSVPPKVPPKMMTMTKIAESHGGGIVPHEVEKTRDPEPDGPISEVKFGNRVLKRIPVPDSDELIAEGLEQYFEIKAANPDISDEEAKRLAQKKIKTIKRNNKMIDQYEDIDTVKEASLVKDADGKPVDTSTPEGRAAVAKEGPKVMARALREQMEKAGPLTAAEEKMLQRLEALGDIEDTEEYEKEAMKLLADMQKVESMRKGVPDVAEAVIMCVMNKQGLDCIAPAGETYKVSDLIVFPPEDDPENPNSAEYIIWLESAGGLSVKWKGGAASGARAKIEITAFKNEETQQQCTDVLDLHNNFMGTKPRGPNSPGEPLTAKRIVEGKAALDTKEEWAREQGLLTDDDFDENGDMILPGSKPPRSTKQWSADSVADWQEKGSLPPNCTPSLKAAGTSCLTKANKKLLLDSLEQYCRGGIMLQHMHNRDLDYQPYGNANGTADGLELSNGIDCVNEMKFQPNPGFDFTKDANGNHIVRPNAVYAGNLHRKCE